MPRFEVYSNGTLIGFSDLEYGDPPMGVAWGRFNALPAVEQIRNFAIPNIEKREVPPQDHLGLVVRDVGGEELVGSGGTHITDCSTELGPEGLEIEVLGIGYPRYERLFPRRVAAYRDRLQKS